MPLPTRQLHLFDYFFLKTSGGDLKILEGNYYMYWTTLAYCHCWYLFLHLSYYLGRICLNGCCLLQNWLLSIFECDASFAAKATQTKTGRNSPSQHSFVRNSERGSFVGVDASRNSRRAYPRCYSWNLCFLLFLEEREFGGSNLGWFFWCHLGQARSKRLVFSIEQAQVDFG